MVFTVLEVSRQAILLSVVTAREADWLLCGNHSVTIVPLVEEVREGSWRRGEEGPLLRE